MGKVTRMYADSSTTTTSSMRGLRQRTVGSRHYQPPRRIEGLGDNDDPVDRRTNVRMAGSMSSEAFVKLAMIQLMLHRLESSDTDSEFHYRKVA